MKVEGTLTYTKIQQQESPRDPTKPNLKMSIHKVRVKLAIQLFKVN